MVKPSPRPAQRTRWWPAVLIVFLTAASFAWMSMSPSGDHQGRTFQLLGILLAGFLLLLGWALAFSKFSGRRKLGLVGGLIAAVVLIVGLFRIEGVSGDLVPILAFRWSGPAALEAGTGAAAVASTPYDFPQFLGVNRDATITGVELMRDWQVSPPRERWRRPVGDGWSGFVVVGNAAVTFEQRNGEQVVVRYDLETGDVVWSHGLPGSFESVIGGNGPRSTPTVSQGQVFAFGPLGTLRALDLASGSLLWQRDVAGEHDATRPEWGFTSSPLVIEGHEGRLVVVSVGAPGASLVAYDAESGEPAWQAGDSRVGYSSPILRRLGGKRQILILNGNSVAGHDPQDGHLLWSHPWPGEQPNVAVPIVLPGDKVLVSSGYGVGASLFHVAAAEGGNFTASELWHSPRLKAKFTNPVASGDHIYGLDDGVMTCLDPADGSRCWKGGRYGHGQNLLIGNLLLVQTEGGEVVLVDAAPDAHRELATLRALDDKSWNPPAIAGRYLLMRNSKEAVCFELPVL